MLFKLKRIKRGEDIVPSVDNGLDIMADGENFILEIQTAKESDSGTYTLIASNRVGKISCKTELIVQGKSTEKN